MDEVCHKLTYHEVHPEASESGLTELFIERLAKGPDDQEVLRIILGNVERAMPFQEKEVKETVGEVINPLLKTDAYRSTARSGRWISADGRTATDGNSGNLHVLKRITALLIWQKVSSRAMTLPSSGHTLASGDFRSTTATDSAVPSFAATADSHMESPL